MEINSTLLDLSILPQNLQSNIVLDAPPRALLVFVCFSLVIEFLFLVMFLGIIHSEWVGRRWNPGLQRWLERPRSIFFTHLFGFVGIFGGRFPPQLICENAFIPSEGCICFLIIRLWYLKICNTFNGIFQYQYQQDPTLSLEVAQLGTGFTSESDPR